MNLAERDADVNKELQELETTKHCILKWQDCMKASGAQRKKRKKGIQKAAAKEEQKTAAE